MKIRILRREEIEKVRTIDRSEIIEQIYYLKDACMHSQVVYKEAWNRFLS
jgi:hypothetical protein